MLDELAAPSAHRACARNAVQTPERRRALRLWSPGDATEQRASQYTLSALMNSGWNNGPLLFHCLNLFNPSADRKFFSIDCSMALTVSAYDRSYRLNESAQNVARE